MNEHGLSRLGEHESEADDGKLPVQKNSAPAQSHGCAQRGKPKIQSGKKQNQNTLDTAGVVREDLLPLSHCRGWAPIVSAAEPCPRFNPPTAYSICKSVRRKSSPFASSGSLEVFVRA